MAKSEYYMSVDEAAESPYCLVVLGGDIDEAEYLREVFAEADYCICADSGCHMAAHYQRVPDLIIGDMDSAAEELVADLIARGAKQLAFPPEKDYTDGELAMLEAISYCSRNDIPMIAVAGSRGDRLDHSFANLLIGMAAADAELAIVYYYATATACILKGRTDCCLSRENGEVVSLLPLGGAAVGISLSGFQYPLEDTTILPQRAWGISNVLQSAIGEIHLQEGYLLVVQNKQGG